MRVDLRRFKVSRVSVGKVEGGEPLEGGDESGFPSCITSIMSPCIIT